MTLAVLGFYSDATQEAALRRTFEQFTSSDKQLIVHSAEREGELHTLSLELGDRPIACIHPEYRYPTDYLERFSGVDASDSIWTADRTALPGTLAPTSNPDVYQSVVPSHVFRLLYSKHDRHFSADKRLGQVAVKITDTGPVETNGALPNRLHSLNGLYWLVDYAHRMDRRCIEAYLDFKKIGRDALGKDDKTFLASLTSLQHRHLLFFLNTNISGKRAIDYIAKHVDLSTVKTGLDVGAGYGGLVKAMIDRGCEGTGLEIMKSLTDLAKLNLSHHLQAKHIVGDFLKEALPAQSYDLITMTDVIEHVASAEDAMARTAQLLRPGGYAYIKVPNYQFIDHVREDAHTGLFGITLLRHDPAAAYLKAVKNATYSVGDYHDYDYYVRTFAKYGVALVRSDNVQSPLADLSKLRDTCGSALTRWETECKIDPEIKTGVRRRVTDYLRDFDQQAAPKKKYWVFKAEPDPLFLRDYLTAHWNLFFQKR